MVAMPHWPKPLWLTPHGTPLERTKALLERMGNPHLQLPPVVHVAGTNGKGSVITYLKEILTLAGYKVHAYMPPHITEFNERIILNGKEIDDAHLHKVIEKARVAAGDDLHLSFFDGTTAAAFQAFSEVEADILLLETGLGGVIDSTNVVEEKLLSIITPIFYDHMEHLGETLEEIAIHKAGIMKEGVAAVVSFQQPEVKELLEKYAEKFHIPAHLFGTHWGVVKGEDGFTYTDDNGSVDFPNPKMLGDHQIINAGTAIAALSLLHDFEVSAEHIAEGLQRVQKEARLEKITNGLLSNYLKDGWELWFDGGHNASAGYAMAQLAGGEWGDMPLYLITGTTEGKDAAAMLAPLKEHIAGCYAVKVESEPKSYSAEAMAKEASYAGIEAVVCDSVDEAVEQITKQAKEPSRILVFGSLYLRPQLL
jgi:dihydrofolate synthase/folylpolyglutamate synthase